MKYFIVSEAQLEILSIENRNFAYSGIIDIDHRLRMKRKIEDEIRQIEIPELIDSIVGYDSSRPLRFVLWERNGTKIERVE